MGQAFVDYTPSACKRWVICCMFLKLSLPVYRITRQGWNRNSLRKFVHAESCLFYFLMWEGNFKKQIIRSVSRISCLLHEGKTLINIWGQGVSPMETRGGDWGQKNWTQWEVYVCVGGGFQPSPSIYAVFWSSSLAFLSRDFIVDPIQHSPATIRQNAALSPFTRRVEYKFSKIHLYQLSRLSGAES